MIFNFVKSCCSCIIHANDTIQFFKITITINLSILVFHSCRHHGKNEHAAYPVFSAQVLRKKDQASGMAPDSTCLFRAARAEARVNFKHGGEINRTLGFKSVTSI